MSLKDKKPYQNAFLVNPLNRNPFVFQEDKEAHEALKQRKRKKSNPVPGACAPDIPKDPKELEDYFLKAGAFDLLPAIRFQKSGDGIEVVSELTGEKKHIKGKEAAKFLGTFGLKPGEVKSSYRVPDVPGVFQSAVNPILNKKVNQEIIAFLRTRKTENPKITAPALAHEVYRRWGITISDGYVRRLLKRKGANPLKRKAKKTTN